MNPFLSQHLVYRPLYAVMGNGFRDLFGHFEKTQWLPPEVVRKQQLEKLKGKLLDAYCHVPFYKKVFDRENFRPEKIRDTRDLLRLPVLTKKDLKDHLQDLLHRRPRGLRYIRETSGSTGTPLSLYKDGENIAVMDAVMYRNYRWFGIGIGDRQARYWGSPLGGGQRAAVAMKDLLLNRVRFSPFRLSEDAYREYLNTLYRFRPAYVYGYAQTISSFAGYLLKKGVDLRSLNLKAVIVTGEMATGEQIASIESAFGSPVSNEYGCTEVGIMAMECPRKGMHLMNENLLIEFVREGQSVSPGEEGEVVVTELYGSAMPLIRYQVGDLGSYTEQRCPCGRGMPLMGHLKGRNDEFILCRDGKRIDPIIFEYVLKEIHPRNGKITQFRITQTSTDHLEVEACYDGMDFAKITRLVTEKLKKGIGAEFSVDFRKVDAIPPEPSGKLRCFVSRLSG